MTEMASGVKNEGGGRGWTRALLIGSVSLNLLVAGVVIGGLIGNDRRPPRPVIDEVSIGPFTDALSPEDREALRRAAQAEGQNFRDIRKDAADEMRRVIDALEADPFNREQVEGMIRNMRTRAMERFAIGERLMVERLAQMSPEARQAFAERLRVQTERFERGEPPMRPPN